MKTVLKLEELGMLLLGLLLFSQLHYSWWWFLVLFLSPDIGMLGYLFGNRTGAITYNIFHHKGIAVVMYILGKFMGEEVLQFAGILLFAHASFDRSLGYGLKYKSSFHHTHLGNIGKEKNNG